MNKLSELLRERMEIEDLSVRDAAKMIGVSHSTVARAANGETVEVDTLVRIAKFLGVPVEDVLDVKDNSEDLLRQIVMIVSIEPELSRVFGEIARRISAKELDPKVLTEVAAFTAYRISEHERTRVEKEHEVKVVPE
jgi:transcriptional regulator with XRE-family HTH domain